MAKSHKELLRELRADLATERLEEVEYGLKELIQGLLIGFIIGFIVALQLI